MRIRLSVLKLKMKMKETIEIQDTPKHGLDHKIKNE